jgi:hypothetical protein
MDIPRLAALNSHWAGSPPVHVMLARFLGYERHKPKPATAPNDELGALLGMLTPYVQ